MSQESAVEHSDSVGERPPPAAPVERTARTRPSVGRMLLVAALIFGVGIVLGCIYMYAVFPAVFGRVGPVSLERMLLSWVFGLGPVILAGAVTALYLLPKRPLLGLLACLLMTGAFVEMGLRLCMQFKKAGLIVPAEKVGWRAADNARWEGDIPGYGFVGFSTQKNGFRRWGDPATTKTKLLVLGDSYSHGHRVSDGEAYYERIAAARPDVELFAYGCMSYSSLQEYMILDRYMDEIQPDLILWQFCQNDIVANSYEVESMSLAQSNHIIRPYLEADGVIRWLYPKERQQPFGRLVAYSGLLRSLDARRDVKRAATWWSIEKDLRTTHSMYLPAAKLTSDIMGMVKKRAGDVPVVAFCVDAFEVSPWMGTAYEDACRAHGIEFMEGIPQLIEAERKKGKKVDHPPFDSHWNGYAHGVAAAEMLKQLGEKGHLPPLAPGSRLD